MSKLFRAGLQRLRKWESIAGFTIFGLFFISSMLLNNTVQALNQAAGNYGYYLGTYGYNASAQSSDDLPKAPTSMTSTVNSTASITFSWTAPTQTALNTSLNNLSGYCYKSAATSAPSNCALTDTTTTATSVTLTGLTPSTIYHINVRSYDENSNLSSTALTGSATTNAEVGGGGGGGTASSVTPSAPAPVTTPGPVTTPAPTPGPTTQAVQAPLPQKFVAPVAKVAVLKANQLTNTAAIASATGVAPKVIARELGAAQKEVRADLKSLGVKVTGNVEKQLANLLAAAKVLNSELNKKGQLTVFVKKFLSSQGKKALVAAGKSNGGQKLLASQFFSQALKHKAPVVKAKPAPKKKAPATKKK